MIQNEKQKFKAKKDYTKVEKNGDLSEIDMLINFK